LSETINTGEFLNRMMELIRKNGREVALYVFAVGGVAAIGIAIGVARAGDGLFGIGIGLSLDAGRGFLGFLFQIFQAIFAAIATYLLIARMLQTEGRLPNKDLRILAYIGMSILSWLGIIVGLFLFIVPGLLFATRWTPAAGFLIAEQEGVTDSLAKSWLATSGNGWSIFFGGVILVLFNWFVVGLAAAPFSILSNPLIVGIAGVFASTLGGLLFTAYGIAVFTLLTSTTDELEDVFA